MLSPRIISLCAFLSLLLAISAFAEESLEQRICRILVDEGFENVAAKVDSEDIMITYENRIYRYEISAFNRVIEILETIDLRKKITVIIQRNKIPLICIQCKANSQDITIESTEILSIVVDQKSVSL